MGEQLIIPALRSDVLPFAVRQRTVRKLTKKTLELMLKDENVTRLGDGAFAARALAHDQAMLTELRLRSPRTARRAAAFAGTPGGRRVHRLMDVLSDRIADREGIFGPDCLRRRQEEVATLGAVLCG